MTNTHPAKAEKAISVAVIAFNGISPFHLSVPCLVFGEDRCELGVTPWRLRICSPEGRRLRTSAGFDIDGVQGLKGLAGADLVIVPSWRNVEESAPVALLRALRRAHQRGARIVGLCLGAFVVAETGLLDGRGATTHWHFASQFIDRFPQVALDASVLYLDEGDVVTSAGTAGGLDCCLHLLRQHCGVEVANRVARRLVLAPHRTGGQQQFIEQPLPAAKRDEKLGELLAWMGKHLDATHDVDSLAARVAMSRRTFTRRFRQATGCTVVQWLTNQRVSRAQRLLETTDQGMEWIAEQAGFGSAVSLRQHFVTVLATSPSRYRAQFRRPHTHGHGHL